MGATPWRFKSSRPHHFETNALSGGRFSFLLTHCGRVLQNGNGRIGRFLMMKQCLENGVDIIVVDEALERPYKSWLEVAQTTGDSRFLKEIMADCQQRFSRKMDEKGVTPLIPDPETAARLL